MASNLERVGVLLVAEGIGSFLGLMADAGKAVVGFLGDSINIAGDFEQTMNKLGAVSGATAEEIALISDKAKDLGADLTLPATSAVDAGEAMLELSKAGFTVQQTMDAAKGTLQLAAAAQIEEAKAAEITANAINAFNLEAKDSIFVADLLAATANASSVEITDVAASYQMAGAIFSAFQGPVVGAKESLVDLTTAIGILGNAGIKGSDAGTSLKQALLQLTGPSMKAKDAMKALYLATLDNVDAGQNLDKVLAGNAGERAKGLAGLQESAGTMANLGDIAYDAAGNMRPFEEILALTAKATKGMTDEQRNLAITTIFGADAARAILILMNKGPEAWDAMTGAVTREGAATDLATAQTKGYKGALEGAKSQLETLQLTIGEKFLPILADLLSNYISPGIAQITAFTAAIFGDKEAFDQLNPTLQGVARWLDSAQAAWGYWEKGIISTRTALDTLLPGLGDRFAPIVDRAIQLVGFLSDNFQTIFSLISDGKTSIGDIVSLIGNLGETFGLTTEQATGIVSALGKVGDVVTAIRDNMTPILSGLAAMIIAVAVPAFVAWAGAAGTAAAATIAAMLPVVAPIAAIGVAVGVLVAAWQNDWLGIQTTLTNFWTTTGQPIFNEVVTWLQTNIPIAIQKVTTFWNTVLWPALQKVGAWIQTNLVPILSEIGTWLKDNIPVAVRAAAVMWDTVLWPALKKVWEFISGSVIPIFVALFNVNFAIAKKVTEALAGLWQNVLWPALQKVGNFINETLVPAFRKAGDYLSVTFGPLLDKLTKWLGDVSGGFGGVSDKIQGVIDWLNDMAKKIDSIKLPDWLTPGSPTPLEIGLIGIASAIKTEVNPAIENLGIGLSHVSKGGDAIKESLVPALALVKTQLSDMTKSGESVVANLAKGITDNTTTLLSSARDLGAQMIAQFGDDGRKAADALTNSMKDALDFRASIPRALDSIDSFLKGVSERLRPTLRHGGFTEDVQRQVQQALGQAQTLDPKAAAQFFKLRTDQIKEMTALQEQLFTATDAERGGLQTRIARIFEAQKLELQSFLSQIEGGGGIVSPPATLAQLLTGSNTVTNYGPQINYSPNYASGPSSPTYDYAVLQALTP